MKNAKTQSRVAGGAANTATNARRRRNLPNPKTTAIARSAAAVDTEIAHAVCAITNSFCENSRGSKWPDESTGQTISIPVRQRVMVTTNGNGEYGSWFTSSYPYGWVYGSMAGGAFTFLGEAAYAPINSTFRDACLVSGGIQFTPTLPFMSAQGVCNMIELPAADICGDFEVDTLIKAYPSYETLPLRNQESLFGIMRPSGPEARQFFPQNTNSAVISADGHPTHDWSSIGVFIIGAPADTVVGFIDLFLNYEMFVDSAGSYAYLTTPPPPPNPTLTRASAQIARYGAIRRGDADSIDRSWISDALGAIRTGGRFLLDNANTFAAIGNATAQIATGNYAGGALTLAGSVPTRRSIQDRRAARDYSHIPMVD